MTTIIIKLRRRLAGEDGWAVVTALMLLTIILGSSLAVARLADNETRQSGATRTRETAFNVGEAALNAQVIALARNWSYVPASPLSACGSGLASAASCPVDAQLRGMFPTSDANGMTWRTDIRDNVAPYTRFYSDALLAPGTPNYDANHDDRVWVRATATAQGRTRTIVALVRAQQEHEDVVRYALVSGSVDLRNSGNKLVVDAGSGGVQVGCTPVQGSSTPCIGYEWKGNQTYGQLVTQVGQQIQPANITTGYTGGLGLSQEALDRLKMIAWANGTYYDAARGCPTSLEGVVWIAEGVTCGSFTGNTDVNAPPKEPGFLVANSGTLTFRGTQKYYGVIIHLNKSRSSGTVVDINGDTCIKGAVLVDGPGTTTVGSSGQGCPDGNISYDPSAFGAVKSIATSGIVQNSWRELRPR